MSIEVEVVTSEHSGRKVVRIKSSSFPFIKEDVEQVELDELIKKLGRLRDQCRAANKPKMKLGEF